VADAIRSLLGARQVQVGVSSAADGADILFLEAMRERGAETHLMLPAPPEPFAQASVEAAWRERFERVLAAATTVTVLAREVNDPVDYIYANDMLLGLAKVRGAQYNCRLAGIAVWDGEPGLPGGSGSAVRRWTSHAIPTVAIDPRDASRRDVDPAGVPGTDSTGEHRVAYLLFADAQGFSKLSSRDVSVFTDRVLSPLGATLDAMGERVLCRNTWGDAVYVAFDNAVDAASFANDIVESCAPERIAAMGLPDAVKFRVSLHAGPVREVFDPVSRSRNFIGPHVSWAARIEPITPPGSVFSSEAFAALCSLAGNASQVECEYVGHVPLAKGYATLPTYRVSRVPRAGK
jgi:class 3 adenylate cyclase